MDKKRRIFNIISIGNREDLPSRCFDIFIAITIVVNIAIMVLETYDEFISIYPILQILEIITIVIFCIEYILRIWTADLLYPDAGSRGQAILKFLISYDGIIDLFTILPFVYLSGFVAFRMLRVVRIFHLFRINSTYDSFNVITTVIKEKINQILSAVFILLVLMLASSIGMYSAEHDAQPEAFKNAFSGIWWSVSALLTVGYGDIYPITVAGKIMAIITAFLGVGVVAIPTGIISAGFVEQYSKIKSIDTFTRETDINFVNIHIGPKHNWLSLTLQEINMPQGLNIALILRSGDVVIPRGDTTILEGDTLLLAAETYNDDLDIKLTEKFVGPDHPWSNHLVKDLDISRQTTIVSIHRKNRNIIPHGTTLVKAGDTLILYSKHLDTSHL